MTAQVEAQEFLEALNGNQRARLVMPITDLERRLARVHGASGDRTPSLFGETVTCRP
jgi:hypothetical protein